MDQNAWWDTSTHSSGSFLDGKRGVIREPRFERVPAKDQIPERTALIYKLVIPNIPDDKQPFPARVSCGGKPMPAKEPGGKPCQEGPHVVGKIDKKAYIHIFIDSLVTAGFPMEKFAKQGALALDGADVTIRGIDQTFKIDGEKQEASRDIIGEFHGFVTGDEAEGEAAEGAADDEALTAELNALLLDVLEERGGTLPRAQISLRLSKPLKDNPNRTRILELATDDAVLGALEGITVDPKGKAISLAKDEE